jgi:predicted amidohydrolase YtcJ
MEKADLIVHNAHICSMDPKNTVYQAMAIRDGRILELGAERQILNKYSAGKMVDAAGKTIYPGFIDAHCHFLYYALGLREVNLVGVRSMEEVIARIEEHRKQYSGTWIIGRGWDQNDWEDKRFPDRTLLDSLYSDIPVYLSRVDGHAALANAKVLELAGITPKTTIQGGEVEVIAGRCTGILVDNAMQLVDAVKPPYSDEEKIEAMMEAERNCFSVGLTGLVDAGLDVQDILLIKQAQDSGKMRMKLNIMISDKEQNIDWFRENGPLRAPSLSVTGFKFFADGALGSRGACLLEPYSDVAGDYHGLLLSDSAYFRDMAKMCYDLGFQMNTHCIGDSANRLILTIYSEVLKGQNDRRWRIEHAQVVHSEDLGKYGAFTVIPSVQPTHATSDMYWAGERLGKERMASAYAFRELKEQLGWIPLGTDFPVEDINPVNTYRAAVYRRDREGYPPSGFQPENALTAEDALRGMTIWAALSFFEENDRGSLEPGKAADFVLFNMDLTKSPFEKLGEAKCLGTWINGENVFQSE